MFNMILNIGELSIGVKRNLSPFLKLMSLRPLSGYISSSRLTEAPASREQARAQARASSLMTDISKSQADTAEPVPTGEGKCCDARKDLLSVPAMHACAGL